MKKQIAWAVLAAAFTMGTVSGAPLTGSHTAHAQTATIVDPALLSTLAGLTNLDSLKVILTYEQAPTQSDLDLLAGLGITSGKKLKKLPIVITSATKVQLQALLGLENSNVKAVYTDKKLQYFLEESVAKIGAKQVWSDPDLGYTGRGVGVAVIDSGIDGTHPDLQFGKRTVQNVKVVDDLLTTFINPVYVENVLDSDNLGGHGTHCAGIIAADGTSTNGRYKGVAPDANLIGVSSGAAILVTTALEGMDYVLANKDRYNIQVVSNSWGTTGAYDPNDPINVASKALHDAGVTVVFAAGNEGPGENTLNPYSVAPWVIGVAAGNKNENVLADFSSRGIPGDSVYKPTITAPGVDIISAKAKQSVLAPLSLQTDLAMIPLQHLPYWTTMSGTSMATPHIAGVLALMEEANPNLTPDQAKAILENTAIPMPGYQEFEVGKGYVDALAAVRQAKQ
ncbi:hypothetical protein CBW65_19035 [Tumebacillus avium]|uniref:Peptidase S8/S53 domain-containing protein n=1 Tax=Tumebacillus avium TaxID=1903704 RepID=A0A1Y0ITP0_9BACL|nr:S8 family serine peptidase [Tumebacillus avium]ARU62835.1 hypothetical protein CBW65_19035 [Tumebacillus avium]